MRVIIALTLLVASTLALPPQQLTRNARASDSATAEIVKFENDNIGIDGYKFAYETSDGISRDEEAVVNNLGSDTEELSVKGFFEYLGDDGQTYRVDYIADKNGFQPSAPHIPAA